MCIVWMGHNCACMLGNGVAQRVPLCRGYPCAEGVTQLLELWFYVPLCTYNILIYAEGQFLAHGGY